MSIDLPELFFRTRDNGAFVYKVGTNARQQRIEMQQIAVANIHNDVVRPHGKHELSDHEMNAINDWMARRKIDLQHRKIDDIFRVIDHLNQTTQWVQSKATDEDLDKVTDELLLTLHDLRSVLVKKKSEKLKKKMQSKD